MSLVSNSLWYRFLAYYVDGLSDDYTAAFYIRLYESTKHRLSKLSNGIEEGLRYLNSDSKRDGSSEIANNKDERFWSWGMVQERKAKFSTAFEALKSMRKEDSRSRSGTLEHLVTDETFEKWLSRTLEVSVTSIWMQAEIACMRSEDHELAFDWATVLALMCQYL